jgi:electron transport complex protein RnfG
MSGALRLVIVLFLVCGVAAGSLALVNAATKERIAAFARQEKAEAMNTVLPGAEDFVETIPGRAWEARRGGQLVGYVVAASTQGYSGPIEALLGIDPQGTLTGARVLVQTETPGLGAKIGGDKFLAQFHGLRAPEIALKRDDPTGAVDAVTAATISSRALTACIRKAADAFQKGELK